METVNQYPDSSGVSLKYRLKHYSSIEWQVHLAERHWKIIIVAITLNRVLFIVRIYDRLLDKRLRRKRPNTVVLSCSPVLAALSQLQHQTLGLWRQRTVQKRKQLCSWIEMS